MIKRSRLLLIALLVSLFLPMLPSAYAAHDDFVIVGIETGGFARGPLFQVYGTDGVFRVGKFTPGRDFTNVNIIGDVLNGADPGTPGPTHERILICAVETAGATRGPIIGLYNRETGAQIFGKFVLGPNFDPDSFQCEVADTDNADDVEEIIVTGRETLGSARGWGIAVYDQTGTRLRSQFLLNNSYDNVFFELEHD